MLAMLLAAAAPAAPAPFCPAAAQAIDAAAAATLKQGSPGMVIAVARGGAPVFVRGYGMADLEHNVPMPRSTVFRLASVTKQFTAAAVLQLADEGRLSLDDRLVVHVPELAQAKEVTLYQLLVQTSGIPDYAGDPALARTKSVPRSGEDMLALIRGLTPALLFAPGSRWAYSNSNYALLGLVLERVERRPLAEIFRTRLFAPAGLTHTAFDDPVDVVPDRAAGYRADKAAAARFRNAAAIHYSVPGAAGGLRTTVDDLVRWQDALFGGRVLTPKALRLMMAPGRLGDGRTTKHGMPAEWQAGLDADYGAGLFITPTPFGPRLWHSGDIDGFSTWLAHYPARRVTVALAINSESADMDKDAIAAAAFRGLDGPC